MGTHDEVVLVTGFPTFRGRKVVQRILDAQPESLVYAVVQPKFTREVDDTLEQLDPRQRERLVVLEGDAAAMDLGLSGDEYRELASRVQRIHHVAQVTYPGVTREMAERVNLGATREILELGKSCKQLRCLVIHSSASVSGTRTGIVREHELSAGQTFRTPVEETLARAERMARASMKDIPICVLRPTQIVGDSQTGEVDRLDGPYLMMLLILGSPPDVAVPLPTRGDAPFNLVPIDYVARAAQFIGRQEAAVGRTFHLADPSPLTVREVFELVSRAGGKRLSGGFIPTGLTRAVFSIPGVNLLAKSPKNALDLAATWVRYDTANADDVLADSGIACPPLAYYVEKLVSHVKQRVQDKRVRYEPPSEEASQDASGG